MDKTDKFCRFYDAYLLEEIKETQTELLAKIEQAERVVRDLYYRLAFKRINGYTLYLVNEALEFK